MKRYLSIFLCMLLVLISPWHSMASAEQLSEAQVKLVIILNFINKYSSWPGAYNLEQTGFVNVCAVGNDAVTKELPVLAKASTDQLKVNILTNQGAKVWQKCHVLYVAEAAQHQLPEILSATTYTPLLTFGSGKRFIDEGGIVGITEHVKHQGNFEKYFVRYEINSKKAQEVGVRLDPDALELATRVIR